LALADFLLEVSPRPERAEPQVGRLAPESEFAAEV
jgi:hypothetical protein